MFSSLLSLLLVVPLIAAIPVPLGATFLKHDKNTHADQMTKFDDALAVANTQIQSMKTALDMEPNDSRIEQTFGRKADIRIIKDTVEKLDTGTLIVETSDPNFADNEMNRSQGVNAYVPINKAGGVVDAEPARFGSTFYSGNSEKDTKRRAGTIIHEATHQLALTGDNVKSDNEIIRAGRKVPDDATINGGYAEKPIIAEDADMGQRYKDLRAASSTMHYNADSYRVFASLCSQSLEKRALTEEDPVGYYLAKRQQCSLPPKAGKGVKTSKSVKGAKASRASKVGKTSKAGKGAKALKTSRGARAGKVGKGSKGVKAVKGVRTAKAGKVGKVAKGGKAAKGVKATKAARTSKGVKATKGKTTASRTAGRKATTSRAPNKAAGKPTRGNAAKSTKATRSSQKVTKAAGKPARGNAAKSTKATAARSNQKATKAAGKPARGNAPKSTKPAAARSGQKATKATPRAATKAAPKAPAKAATKAAPRAAARASVPKKGGKKN